MVDMAFTIWMLVDAYRRPAEQFWYWVIFLFQPIVPRPYFLPSNWATTWAAAAVEAAASGGGWSLPFFNSRPSIRSCYQAEHVPTLANSLALAERLVEE